MKLVGVIFAPILGAMLSSQVAPAATCESLFSTNLA